MPHGNVFMSLANGAHNAVVKSRKRNGETNMRRAFMAAAAAAVLAPGVAWADSITTTSPISLVGSGLYESGDLQGGVPGFNASLGTLTAETLMFSGNFTPGQQWETDRLPPPPGTTYPNSVPVTLTGHVGIADGPLPLEMALSTETAQAIRFPDGSSFGGVADSYVAIGTPEPFNVTYAVPAWNFDTRVGGIELPAWTDAGHVGGQMVPGSGFADLTQLNGTFTVTYSYTPGKRARLPEPASLALLAVGVLGLVGVALRSKPAP